MGVGVYVGVGGIGVGAGLGLAVLVEVGVEVAGNDVGLADVGVAPRDGCTGVGLAMWVACATEEDTGRVVVDKMSNPPK